MRISLRIVGIFLLVFLIYSCKKEEEDITDVDGNVYTSVTIGTQVLMVENLKTTRYRNGDLIGTTTPATKDIHAEANPKYQWAYDGNESNVVTYGRLYTWDAVTDSRNLCPTGWHVPSDAEWTTLTYLGGESAAGGKLKEAGTAHWLAPNTGATNESGFTALPGGIRDTDGDFAAIGWFCAFWSLRRTPMELPSLGSYTTMIALLAWAASISIMVSLFAVCEITNK
jgi:uncharacterized protein (TIGR02145 family)